MRLFLPTVPHVADLVEAQAAEWPKQPEIVLDPVRKWQAFGEADAALCASGTVSLELALCRVPLVSCYRLGPADTDVPRVDHHLDGLAAQPDRRPAVGAGILRPVHQARACWPASSRQLMTPSDARRLQLNGFAEVKKRMATARRPGAVAAETVLKVAGVQEPARSGSKSSLD